MIISHEVPLDLLEDSLLFNDFDYCLVHHYVKYKQYREYFYKAQKLDRFIILDSSVVELGEHFDLDTYLEVEKELKPSVIIAVDNFKEPEKNLDLLHDFLSKFRGSSQIMGVPHGDSFSQYCDNYTEMVKLVDLLGISVHSFSDRYTLIRHLVNHGVIDHSKYHHLLGCYLPQEFSRYLNTQEDTYSSERFDFIKSLDTSNPIIHGCYGIRYSNEGLDSKLKENIDSVIECELTENQKSNIYFNLLMFRKILYGNSNIRVF